ncbi:hypothetical protein QYE76_029053 [Lolium multiflorum]|uniref:Reverse transcriptase RNase H-like domain-containing protein n=1 Tax=Lolium multiflorum TaxID=4521 RepID=A0AAD8QN53_LOLMU|nr:hypothetical protein QYE76_029053 [Lolium multiflorum]
MVLRDAREWYTQQQKLLYTLLIASQKLQPYLQAHPIRVVTKHLLETVLRNPNATGRVAEWTIELQPFELTFDTTPTKKSQALAEFTAEWTNASPDDGEAEEETQQPGKLRAGIWSMAFDGAFNEHGAGSAAIITSPTGDKLHYAVQLRFSVVTQHTTACCSIQVVDMIFMKGLLHKYHIPQSGTTETLQEPVEEEIDEPESSLDEKEEEIDEPESSLDEKEEEIDEPESSLDEKEEESDEQKEEEWISYPCQPSNEIVLHAYRKRMNVMFLWILLKYSL